MYDKTCFSMLSEAVNAHLLSKAPASIVVCGVEAHVCVLQTCLDLVEEGVDVHVAVDAVRSSTALLRATALSVSCPVKLWLVELQKFSLLY